MKLKLEKDDKEDYEYEIYIDDQLVWHGLNPEKEYDKIMKANPDKKVSIAWKPKEGILVGDKDFLAPVFIADSEDVTPILGRAKSLDLFKACFDGTYTNIEEKSKGF